MIGLLGRALLLFALVVAVAGSVVGFSGALFSEAGRRRAARSLVVSLSTIFGACAVGVVLLMEFALLRHDFSVAYVAEVGSLATPTVITVVSLWSSLGGSILLWILVLGVQMVVLARQARGLPDPLVSVALGGLLLVGAFFVFAVSGDANPFAAVDPVPSDGPGPNPLLQNHPLMVLHPPALYLGFVGISVPASMAVAMLVVARVDAAWMALSRRWLLEAWSFLTLGILLGGLWSYEVLGWGGYWAWDPVENASLVPWLTLTACVHAALLAERRGRDLAWALVLAIASFLLVLLGTFMTRSGVFNSVHAFTQSSIGPIFLTFIGLCSLGSVLLCAARLEKLPQVAGTRSLALKEILLRVNVLVLLALAFTVLLGTLYPLGVEAVAGEKVSVGEPYFERMAAPLFVALLLLLVPGVLLPWASTRPFRVQRVVPAGLVALGALVLAGAKGTSPLPLLGIGAGAMAATLTLQGVLDLLRERLGREPPLRALLRGFQMHKRRIAAHLVHLGFALAALAIAAGAGRRVEKGLTLPLGQSVVVGDWSLGFEDVLARREPHRVVEAARFRVETGGREVGILEPSLNHYPTMRQPMGTPAVRMGLFGDLYLSLLSLDRDARSATFRVILEPFVSWIWVAGLVMVLGGLLSAWPRATPSRPEPRSGRGGVS